VIDLDASVVLVASDQRTRAGVGFVPNLATCDNVDNVQGEATLRRPRPGGALTEGLPKLPDEQACLEDSQPEITRDHKRSGEIQWSHFGGSSCRRRRDVSP
jgi:hypothetical protein